MTFVATEIELTADERAKLGRLCGAATSQQREVFRARIVLLAGDGVPTREIARRLGTTPVTVSKWRLRFQALGVLGLTDQDRPGKPPTYGHDDRMRVFETAVGDPPEGHTHWSVRTLAQAVCMGKTRVHEILEEAELRPHQVRSWLTSIDPDFQAKQTEVCGLYLNPPDNAIVISVDEKTGVQAKEPVRETKPMQVGTPERREFEYRRHGTQALLAALLVHTGEVMGQVYDRHTRVEFLDFLEHLEREIPHGKDVHVVSQTGFDGDLYRRTEHTVPSTRKVILTRCQYNTQMSYDREPHGSPWNPRGRSPTSLEISASTTRPCDAGSAKPRPTLAAARMFSPPPSTSASDTSSARTASCAGPSTS